MTTRLYYADALARTFDAVVSSCDADGERFRVVLDSTAFYPTSGGQPFDTGRLGAGPVVEVAEGPDDAIVHVVTAELPRGTRVHGDIDWPRRFDHMQQHTGQHLLSAVLAARANAATTSFHMGAESATIDLDRDQSAAAIADAETAANQIVSENRAVHVRIVPAEEAGRLPLRKPPARSGSVRLVEIEGCDLSACGGTHVPATGMIGAIVTTASERFKGGTRLTFVCGGRAVRSHGRFRDIVLDSTRVLSVTPGELPAAIERLRGDVKALTKALRDQGDALAQYRAEEIRAQAETLGRFRVVIHVDPQQDAGALKTLAAAVTSVPGFVAVFAGGGQPMPLVVSRSADVDLDAAALVRGVVGALGGRGGGRPEAAQAGLTVQPDRVLAFVRDALRGP